MSGFVVKILAGPHAGAQIALAQGNYLIGTAEDNDLVFSDPALAKHHVKLILSDSGFAIKPLAMPVFLKGKPLADGGGVFSPFDIITAGDTHLAVAAADATWPASLPLPKIRKKAHDSAPLQTGEVPHATTRAGLNRWWLAAACVCLALGYGLRHSWQTDMPIISKEAQLSTLLDDMPLYDLKILKQPDGNVRLTGYVPHSRDLATLKTRLQASHLPIVNRVTAIDEVKTATERVLAAIGYPDLVVMATTETPGVIEVSGFVDDDSARRRIVDTLRYDIPGIKNIEDSGIETLEQRLAYLKQEIKDSGLADSITAASKNGALHVTGEVSSLEREQWQSIEDMFIAKYGEAPALENSFTRKTNAFTLNLRSVSIGKTAFLTTQNGKKFIEGAHIKDGYTIKSILPGKIVLSGNGGEIDYHYGQKANN
ncbi:MAG TPA: EscD/YscD/HrpQ family type III secretion system inner membrane ring protein [Gammaproteobacteria bacterium]|nr:EscD/YscD/HrpQ family type III secretion system inner membrane ring protein [Gammaproteobacteria bacterium]